MTDKPQGHITGSASLDLTAMTSPEDLGGIASITGVAQVLVPESLLPAFNRIPQEGVAAVIPVPDGIRTQVHTGTVTFGGDALAAPGAEDQALVVTGSLIVTSPVEKVTFREVIITGLALAPRGSEAALTSGLSRVMGTVEYYDYAEGQRIHVRSGQGRVSGETLANRNGSPEDVLVLAGQFAITGPVEEVGYQLIVAGGQCLAPGEAEAVLAPVLSVHGQLAWYDGEPRIFVGSDQFGRSLFELLDPPADLLLVGGFTIDDDVEVELFRRAVRSIVLVGSLRVPPHLLGAAQLLTVEKQGSIKVHEGAGDRS